ncbi:substrate-binding periplasmic protein [Aestuariirhabdus litorea]|uniref:substrate-binding periplasmic protein n=1 Tax=Aestuariirhabdus litorea TaxID=2528527 RepID=UPI0013E2A42D|nr:transporter substrate-binding domain-containing protein [Aestuariirhabdus litorea]
MTTLFSCFSPLFGSRTCGRLALSLVGLALVLLWPRNDTLADEIVLASPDYWCPFSCKAGEEKEGFAVDIIRAIFSAAGHRVRLVNENYSRALVNVRTGLYTATPSTFKEEAPGFVFPELPVSRNRYCFFALPDSEWRFEGEASLRNRKTGIIRNYSYGEALDPLIQAHPQWFVVHSGDNLTERMIRRVALGRMDAFVEEENLVSYSLSTQPGLAMKNVGCTRELYAYMAISPANPKAAEYAELFSSGLRALHQSGQLREILARYGIEEWPLPTAP